MNSKIRLASFLFCLVTTTISHASQWTAVGEIETLYFHSSYSDGVFLLRGPVVNPENCPNTDLLFLEKSNPHYDDIYSLLLAARLAKLEVKVYVSGCNPGSGRPKIEHVIM